MQIYLPKVKIKRYCRISGTDSERKRYMSNVPTPHIKAEMGEIAEKILNIQNQFFTIAASEKAFK